MQEKNLYIIWEKLNTPVLLYTRDEQPVIIHHCGERNRYTGPDYLNCVVEYNGAIYHGAIEIHTRASDWFNHGHHLQKQYSDIILHVVAEADIEMEKLRLIPAPTVLLSPNKASHAGRLDPIIHSRQLSLRRLHSRKLIYSQLLTGYSFRDLLMSSIFKACGYPVNQHAFGLVYQHISTNRSHFIKTIFGLFPPTGASLFLLYYGQSLVRSRIREKILKKLDNTGQLGYLSWFHIPQAPRIEFQAGGVHPANHPLIKLEQLYYFMRQTDIHSLPGKILNLLMQYPETKNALLELFRLKNHHNQILNPNTKHLLSRNRLHEWLVTDCIPLYLAAYGDTLKDELLRIYYSIPAGYQPPSFPKIKFAWQLQAYKAYLKRNENVIPE